MQFLKDKWDALTPEKKRMVIIGGIAAVVIGAIYITDDGGGQTKAQARKEADAEAKHKSSLVRPSVRDNTGDVLAAEIEQMRRQLGEQRVGLNSVQKNLLDQRETEEKMQSSAEAMEGIRAAMDSLASDVAMLKSGLGDTGNAIKVPELQPPNNESGRLDTPALESSEITSDPVEAEPAKPRGPSIRVISGGGGKGSADSQDLLGDPQGASGKNVAGTMKQGAGALGNELSGKEGGQGGGDTTYLPAGTIMQGVLLTGMDAPTNGVGERNPVPALVRLKADAILPNRFRHDVRECFALVAGKGSLSTERVELRAETISCIRSDGRTVEARIDGYVTGEDGKVGMRGRVVTKQGAVLARSLIAGTLGGFAKALQPFSVPSVNLSGSGSVQTQRVDLGDAAQNGLMGGAEQAASGLSKFYLDLAKELFPVLEIDANRKVHIVLVRGASLSFGVK